ncbi:hypothetical protein [Lapillicoccus sp.]|uniref:hypothetical protein n=1 Tax=Lapillicoccus sp. TaxID=1909287 RepID=UPI00398325B1
MTQQATSAPEQVIGVTGAPDNPLRVFLSSAFEGTPGRMRLLGAVAALAAAVFGIVGATILWSSSAALSRADHDTAQVVRSQGIYADLLRADASATNAFLVGGLENPAQRADYDATMSRVAAAIAEAATAQPADGTALGQLNAQVQTYAATVEQARVYNRQGLPIGSQYLNNASLGLRTTTLPVVAAVTSANAQRADQEFGASSTGVALGLVGTLALIVLVVVIVWLARRTHRYLNVPLTVAAGLVLVALLLGTTTLGSVGSGLATVRGSDYKATLALANARSAAFDAKSNESLTLIARAGNASETKWKTPSESVLTNLVVLGAAQGSIGPAGSLRTAWNAYVTEHVAIRKLDDDGTWDQAVAAATKTDPASANARFTAFTSQADQSLETFRAATQAKVTEPQTRVTVTGWVLLIICLAAALLALRGISQRLEEYR